MSGSIGNNGGRLYSFGNQPVLIDCNFVVDPANNSYNPITGLATGGSGGLGIRNLKGEGVQAVFMHTTATPGKAGNGLLNPNPAAGYCWVQLKNNYARYLGGFNGFVSPTTGSTLAINSTALTIGNPYVIASVGAAAAGTATVAPVADVNGSLASTYFVLYDSYGNTWVIWNSVSGVGVSPSTLLGPAAADGVPGLHYSKLSFATNASAATIGAALVLLVENLPSGIANVNSFTATGTTTVTIVNTNATPANLPGIPVDGSVATPANGQQVTVFTVTSANATQNAVYGDGTGNLFTVTTTIAAGTTLSTLGTVFNTVPASGTLTKQSGTGDATITYSAAKTGRATGFTFALTVNDFNLADWQGVGLPKGLTPTVGQSFIAKATGSGSSTGTAIAVGVSGILTTEVIGDPNLSFAPMPQGGSPFSGGWILVQFLGPTSTSNPTPIPVAPTTNSVVGFSFYVDARYSPNNTNPH
jgi:hypothetical protein